MGVYIPDMKMPTSCYDCKCFIRDSDGSDYCCLLMIDIEDNNKRDDDCPLVPVSPHGDLIDRDKLKEQLEYVANLEWNQHVGATPGIECAIDMLDDAQTIISTEENKI